MEMKDVRLESYIDGEKSILIEGCFALELLDPKTEVQWHLQEGNIANMPELSKTSLSQKIKEVMLADSQDYNGMDYQIKCIEGEME